MLPSLLQNLKRPPFIANTKKADGTKIISGKAVIDCNITTRVIIFDF